MSENTFQLFKVIYSNYSDTYPNPIMYSANFASSISGYEYPKNTDTRTALAAAVMTVASLPSYPS